MGGLHEPPPRQARMLFKAATDRVKVVFILHLTKGSQEKQSGLIEQKSNSIKDTIYTFEQRSSLLYNHIYPYQDYIFSLNLIQLLLR